ncbi:MAG: methyl-accepting chemotaxis protein [Spirochaetaceae bacterium]|jgi:methyl-accepting chemotaxis protein|nr:methyl-accepting chemotaxis protein [Spirochaetaceae bacterium]
MKLKYRLTAIIAAMMTAVIAIISIILLGHAGKLQTGAARDNLEHEIGLYAKAMEAHYEDYMNTIKTLGIIMGNYEEVDPALRRLRFDSNMYGVLSAKKNFLEIFTVWKPGIIDGMDREYADTPGTDGTGNYMSWYTRESGRIELHPYNNAQAVLADMPAKETISNPMMHTADGKQVFSVTLTAPILRDRDAEQIGIVGLSFNLSYSQTLITEVKPFGVGTAGLYAANGVIVAHHRTERIGRRFQEAVVDIVGPDGITALERSIASGTPVSITNSGLMIQSFPFYVGDCETAWSIVSAVPVKTVLEDVQAMTHFTIIMTITAVFISALIIFIIAKNIAKPIVNVSQTLKDISEGEGDLTQSINITSKDEIGDLAHYFNLTLEKIKNLVIAIKQQAAALVNIGNELASNMTETAAAINEITANIRNIKTRVTNQSASVTETNSAMEQITVNIDKLNGYIENQTASVAQSSSAIEEMLANIQSVTQTLVKNADNVKDLAAASEVGRTGLRAVGADIQEIARESEGLLEINAVMENIASQTNLLSMNAAIEAAHAGEAGKGFAVVADEIRKLAENSGEQSKTISDVLKKIKDSIDKITHSTDAVLNKFEAIDSGVRTVSDQEENIRNAMEEQSTGSQQILEAVGRLNNITQMVKGGSMEMLDGSKEVIQESKNLDLVTQEIAKGMNEMAVGADQINVAVGKVNTISGENKKNIDALVREVSKFKVE